MKKFTVVFMAKGQMSETRVMAKSKKMAMQILGLNENLVLAVRMH